MQLLGFDLLRPVGLIALLAVPLVFLAGAYALRARVVTLRTIVAKRHLRRFLPGFSTARARWRLGFACAGLLFGAIALTGPVRGYTVREIQRRGLDIVVCIDTSRSMLVRDLRPNRLTRAVREVRGLLERLQGDRMALIAFAGDAREIAPLTHDRTTLGALLDQVDPDENLRGGTDLATALERSLDLFDGRTGAHECIVLITDGEDLEGRGRAMAERAAERGIRIYVVGMATPDGGKIPQTGQDGSEGFVRDREGNEVVSMLGDDSLAQIAEITGGDYLSAAQAATPLEDLYEARIERLEGRTIESLEEHVPHDRYQWFLVLAVACVLAESALRERGRQGGAERSRRSSSLAACVLFLPALQQPAGPAPVTQTSPAQAQPQVTAPTTPQAEPETPAAEPYAGSLEQGRNELRTLVEAGEYESARELSASLVALGEKLGGEQLGAALYDRGVAFAEDLQWIGAIEPFARARVLIGGTARLDAAYNLGTVELELAEVLRSQIPEIAGAGSPGAPGSPGAAGGPPGITSLANPSAGDPGPDFLELADQQYRRAKDSLLERLRMDWRDDDTRANLELIQRRLAELEEIREQREQDEEQQDEQQQDQDQESDEQEDSQESEESDEESQENPQDQEPQDDQESDESNEEPSESDEERQDQEQTEQPEPEPSEQEQEQQQNEQPEPQPAEPEELEERYLTKEEVQRLLEQLRKIDEEARELQLRLRNTRRPPVEKDW